MQTLYGLSSLTLADLERLLKRIHSTCANVTQVEVLDVYFLDLASPLSAKQKKTLHRLLPLTERPRNLTKTFNACVIPRQGTVSSWSSKATDIFHLCGFTEVSRLERGRFYQIHHNATLRSASKRAIIELIHDRMMEEVLTKAPSAKVIFKHLNARRLQVFKMGKDALAKLQDLNLEHGLAMSDEELSLLAEYYQNLQSDCSDAELMMFSQVNSEHCRHKLFKALWNAGDKELGSLFDMIRYTKECSPSNILSAYSDNAAAFQGHAQKIFTSTGCTEPYRYLEQEQAVSIKVETHNHPTAIAPKPGAATGSGGEIRDEAAIGRGGRPKAGLTGFCVSHIAFPQQPDPWLYEVPKSPTIASPLQIMIEGPIGAADFNNEFGRPAICGYFRTFEYIKDDKHFAYHKPIMLAGGLGSVASEHIEKQKFAAGTPLLVLGGPAMLIGLGGGVASSVAGGSSKETLDFASVQRDNAEMERRCQEVINLCTAREEHNPILSIHDVGAGGLSNAFPELVHDAGLGAVFDLDKIPCADSSLSPMELWCNESQERYVLAVRPEALEDFFALCERERCPVALVGHATEEQRIVLRKAEQASAKRAAIDMPMDVLFGYLPPLNKDKDTYPVLPDETDELVGIGLDQAATRILSFPTVAGKSFLITIGDRSVGGLIARDQMVGPWQVPVADLGVTCASYDNYGGEALAVGERPALALRSPAASARIAVSEALLNILAADIEQLGDIKLSANWMLAAKVPGQEDALLEAVEAIAKDLCPALGIAIPVGKDSLSMQMVWDKHEASSPLSLVISAFAKVGDVRKTLSPQLRPREEGNRLIFIDLSTPGNPLGGSSLMQAFSRFGNEVPDLSDPQDLINFTKLLNTLRQNGEVLAYHDRSDGGLFVCLAEMAFAGMCGVRCHFDCDEKDLLSLLFSEGPGVVLQVSAAGSVLLEQEAQKLGLSDRCIGIGYAVVEDTIFEVQYQDGVWSQPIADLKRLWSTPSLYIRELRDNPKSANEEFQTSIDTDDPGLSANLSFDLAKARKKKPVLPAPKFAILREQGVNGHVEMAAAFDRAGFACHDVHMSDLLAGRTDLNNFDGLAVCGGFSYGDVLGAGTGWAHSVLCNPTLRTMFETFFTRPDTLSLGVCNGCQMLSQLKEIIPGAQHFPRFERNISQTFESRLVQVEIRTSSSILLQGMEGSLIPITVAHGEGCVTLDHEEYKILDPFICMQYMDNYGNPNPGYPYNPNGSTRGATGFCSEDGRVTIMMPHPERCFRTVQCSWHPDDWDEDGAWMQLFYNAMHFYRG